MTRRNVATFTLLALFPYVAFQLFKVKLSVYFSKFNAEAFIAKTE